MFNWALNAPLKFHQIDNILVQNSSTLELPFVELTKFDILTWIASSCGEHCGFVIYVIEIFNLVITEKNFEVKAQEMIMIRSFFIKSNDYCLLCSLLKTIVCRLLTGAFKNCFTNILPLSRFTNIFTRIKRQAQQWKSTNEKSMSLSREILNNLTKLMIPK